MQENQFKKWLESKGHNSRVVSSVLSRCGKIESELKLELDKEFITDQGTSLLEKLKYSADDERHSRPAPRGLIVNGCIRKILASLKSAAKSYMDFKKGSSNKVTSNPKSKSSVTVKAIDKKDVVDFEYLKKAFGVWLDEKEILSTAASIASYRSYINQLHDGYNEKNGSGSFENVISAYKSKSKKDISKAYVDVIVFINELKQVNRKKWTDIGSGFNQFDSFLNEEFDVEGYETDEKRTQSVKEITYPEVTPQKITKEKKVRVSREISTAEGVLEEFSLKELFNIFKNRLKTQSRYYPASVDLLFPVRLITAIFHKAKDKAFNEWMMSGLRDMIVLGKDEAYRFEDVEKMCFLNDKRVMVVLKNSKVFELYTYNAEGKKVVPLRTQYKGDISIDHIVSLAEKMKKHKNELPAFREMTQIYHEFERASATKLNPRAERTWKNDLLKKYSSELCSKKMRNAILNDLNTLDLHYVLMDQRENSKKGKN